MALCSAYDNNIVLQDISAQTPHLSQIGHAKFLDPGERLSPDEGKSCCRHISARGMSVAHLLCALCLSQGVCKPAISLFGQGLQLYEGLQLLLVGSL